MKDPDRLVPIAEITRPHGIRGELRLRVFNETSAMVRRGLSVMVQREGSSSRPATITALREATKGFIARVSGVEDRNDAEAIQGALLAVARSEFPPLAEGEFYACDVEGASAWLDGERIGEVLALASYPTCDALVIERGESGRVEVPLLDAFVVSVDVEAERVELRTLDGLEE